MAELGTTGQLTLDRRLDLTAAAGLHHSLLAHDSQHLVLDAGAVSHLGALCLQLLIAAADQRRADGRGMRITPRSAAFDAALTTFGLPLDRLQPGGRA
ncbi:MAG: STAS domain-containing protein [Rhodobacteraceae bacterium]|nr:STAS domain-containing protein [Paracoccaceae bacterium]